jgi:hypothetical protein
VSPTPTPLPVPDSVITAAGGTNFFSLADGNGNYSLSMFGPGMYTITASRPDENYMAPNGIFSNDATLVARHVVGLITLDATQIRAADVSGLHSISSFDAALIAQWIVGITNPINRTGKWMFTPSVFSPDTNVDSVQDYSALLTGDVNGDWMPAGMRPTGSIISDGRGAIRASIPKTKVQAGSVVEIPLLIEGLRGREVDSFQFDISYDAYVVEPVEPPVDLSGTVSGGFGFAANSPAKGLLKVVAYGTSPVSTDGVYVYLRFRVNGLGGTSTAVTISGFRINDGKEEISTQNGWIVLTQKIRVQSRSPAGKRNTVGKPPNRLGVERGKGRLRSFGQRG